MSQQKSRREQFLEEINEAMENSPYRHTDKNLHQIYCIGLLRELLAYSALDLYEIRNHIEYLANRPRPPVPKPKQTR